MCRIIGSPIPSEAKTVWCRKMRKIETSSAHSPARRILGAGCLWWAEAQP